MSDDHAKSPRFPYIAALLCVACLGAAAWTWMRYSYCWHVPTAFVINYVRGRWPDMAYARFVVSRDKDEEANFCEVRAPGGEPVRCVVDSPGYFTVPGYTTLGRGFAEEILGAANVKKEIACRVHVLPESYGEETRRDQKGHVTTRTIHCLRLDKAESRLTHHSIAGLVVGAIGVFVFTEELRHWLRERRRFLEDTRGHNTSVDRPPSAS